MRAFLILILWLLAPAIQAAETRLSGVAALKANQITITSGYRTLRASGDVEIVYQTTLLRASAIVYDAERDEITAEGPLRIQDGDAITIVADYAELSGDMRRGILKGARMVLNEQLQITAVEISRTEGRYNQLFKAAASTCTVTEATSTPFWQIRASRIVHDEQSKQLFFENAQLRIGPVPVAYLPRLRVPDPSITRSSGFLVPGLTNSDRYGTGIIVPYFRTLGDYADLTITPTITTTNTFTLGLDYRRRFHNGRLDIKSSLTRDTIAAQRNRGYIAIDGEWRFSNRARLALSLEQVTDNTYLSDLGISNKTRLESKVTLAHTTRRSHLDMGIYAFRSLSSTVADEQIPHLIADTNYRRRFALGENGGHLGLGMSVYGYQRRSLTDILGRDGRRIAVKVDWTKSWITNGGSVLTTTTEFHGANYQVQRDSTYPVPVSVATPILAAEWRLPLGRYTAQASEVIEPRLQLVWSPDSTTAVPDEDSRLVEFAADNLFALNRFTGIDQFERGLRANLGLSFNSQATSGWHMNAMAGQVFRISNPNTFGAQSGLTGTNSAYVLAAQLSLPDRFRMIQRMVFGNGSGLLKNETRIGYKSKRFDLTTSYLWLQQNAAGNTTADQSQWVVDTGWDLGGKWRSGASWRYDLVTKTASDAGLSLTYVNDCIKVDLSLSRRFAASSNVGPSTSLGFQVTLEGFGARADSDAYNRKCSGI